MAHTSRDNDQEFSFHALDLYMRDVRRLETLTEEEEAKLIARVERGRDERKQPCPDQWRLQLAKHARDRLVEAYQPLVIHIAKAWCSRFRSMELLDVIQEGNIGLMKAIDYNDSSKGYPLRALAGRCIRQQIWKAFYQQERPIRLSRRMEAQLVKLKGVEQELAVQLRREPNSAELADALQVCERRVEELLYWRQAEVSSFQSLLQEGNAEEYLDFVSLFDQAVAEDEHRQMELADALQQAIDSVLPESEREVIRLRYGLDGEGERMRTQPEVAAVLGCHVNTVARRERRAKAQLQQALAPFFYEYEDEQGLEREVA